MFNTRIIGGHLIEIEKAPWQVSFQKRGKHICGGSIISENWILTLARCTRYSWRILTEFLLKTEYSFSNSAVFNSTLLPSVRVGSTTHNAGGRVYKTKKLIPHPLHDPNFLDYDIALVELSESLNFDETVKSIQLPESNEEIAENVKCLLTGWGETRNMSESDSVDLRGVNVSILSNNVCKHVCGPGYPSVRMFCAGDFQNGEGGGKILFSLYWAKLSFEYLTAWLGDEGDPLVLIDSIEAGKPKQIGIYSTNRACGVKEFTGVYMYIAAVRDWIHNETGI